MAATRACSRNNGAHISCSSTLLSRAGDDHQTPCTLSSVSARSAGALSAKRARKKRSASAPATLVPSKAYCPPGADSGGPGPECADVWGADSGGSSGWSAYSTRCSFRRRARRTPRTRRERAAEEVQRRCRAGAECTGGGRAGGAEGTEEVVQRVQRRWEGGADLHAQPRRGQAARPVEGRRAPVACEEVVAAGAVAGRARVGSRDGALSGNGGSWQGASYPPSAVCEYLEEEVQGPAMSGLARCRRRWGGGGKRAR